VDVYQLNGRGLQRQEGGSQRDANLVEAGGITFKQLTTNDYLFGPTPPNLTIIQRGDHELIQYLF
jgi:hypothetical protein